MASPPPEREVDVCVIGSGIGGLSAAGLSARYGLHTEVFESHYHPGGVAHSFQVDGYKFDAGPSLWASMNQSSTNPLRQVLDALGEDVEWLQYDGWGMHVPEGYFYFKVGPDDFTNTLRKYGGEEDVAAWAALRAQMKPLLGAATSIPPLVLRGDAAAGITLAPYLVTALLRAGLGVQALQGPFTDVAVPTVRPGSFLYRWLDYMAFALSGLPADATQAAPVIYTLAELHTPNALLDYPRGGSGAVADALVRGLEKYGGKLHLRSHVAEILIEDGRAVGIKLKSGAVIRARRAVISNTSIWDLLKLVPNTGDKEGFPEAFVEASQATPDTASFNHLHLGIDAAGLEELKLNIHYTVINTWDEPIDAPLNMVIVSIPTVLDPGLAPPGKHAVHAYMAGNEPYSLWEGLQRGSKEYEELKEQRTQVLWNALERIIPDIRARAEVTLPASPLTHEMFNRRHRGSYGPGWRAGEGTFPGCTTPIKDLLRCGDSTLPGLGVPAVAASGMHAANTLVPVWQHLKFVKEMQSKGFIVDRFKDSL
ncbi:amine oxidase [Tribonema minus]|uniref:Amine oxidase n=1 Tax=Tribonema minus TaxID=303371 RepID=A0A835Z9G8_9STRA|nr:amine oxidase [Tribonema minus]